MEWTLNSKGWIAFTIIFGFIFTFIWIIHLVELSLFYKLFYTVGGAIATYLIAAAKTS